MRTLAQCNGLLEAQIGGKAMRLVRMVSLNFPVPEALVIETSEVDAVQRDPVMLSEYVENIRRHFEDTPVAVRSSAVGEDGAQSWAGQFKTVLFVTPDRLAEAILECVHARESAPVKAYAERNGVPVPALALIVQKMVRAVSAGVLFTADPTSPRSDRMLVEAVDGVAETLVSGTREPRRFCLDAQTAGILEVSGAHSPELPAALLHELVSQATALRQSFGAEQDVEWAIAEDHTLFLLQSRNITAMQRGYASVHAEAMDSFRAAFMAERERLAQLGLEMEEDVWSDQNIAELITARPPVMTFSLFVHGFAHGHGAIRTARNEMGYAIGDEMEEGFQVLVAGQPRCSIIHDALTYRIRGFPLAEYARLVTYYLGRIRENPSLANYPEIVLYDQNPSEEFLREHFGRDRAKALREAYGEFFRGFRETEDLFAAECRETFLPGWQEDMARESSRVGQGDVAETAQQYWYVCERLRVDAFRRFVKAARMGFFGFSRLRQVFQERYGSEAETHLQAVTSGIPPEENPNLAFNLALFDLKEGRASIEEIVGKFGHLGSHELEIATPRYRDCPDMLQQLAGRLGQDPRLDLEASVERARDMTAKVLTEASPQTRDELAREIRMARTYLALRENVKFGFVRGYDILRRLAVHAENLLAWEGGLIFHLTAQEMRRLAEEPKALQSLARARRDEHAALRMLHVPQIIFQNQLETIGPVPDDGNSGRLSGTGVTDVVSEGEAVVVVHLDDKVAIQRLKPGSILVTTTTDPAWSPVLSILGRHGGLVTEIGGILAHGAIYAREIGMAAVLNVPRATQIIKTGDRIRVNGAQGIVELLDK